MLRAPRACLLGRPDLRPRGLNISPSVRLQARKVVAGGSTCLWTVGQFRDILAEAVMEQGKEGTG